MVKENMIKNIIIVNDYDYAQGGASLVAIESANQLYEHGYNVIFFCSISNAKKSTLNKNIKVYAANKYDCLNNPSKIKGMLQGIYNKKANKLLMEILRHMIIDETVVFIHGYTKSLSTSFINVCSRLNVKTILTAHDYFSICQNGGLYNYKKRSICSKNGKFSCWLTNCDSRNYFYKIYRNIRFFIQDKIYKFRKKINYLITISDKNETLLLNFYKKSHIVRIYNPTSIECKKPRVLCEYNDYYIYVGRIDYEKGIDFLCESFINTSDRLVLCGDGNAYSDYKRKYESSKINFLGWLTHDMVLEKMKKAKCLVFSSLLYEGAPLTIFEAQSIGLPCLVSKYSNATDFIKDYDNGIIYDPKSKQLNCILKNMKEKDIEKMSKSSYESYWLAPYDKSKYLKSLIQLFNSIK